MASSILSAIFGSAPFTIINDATETRYWKDLKVVGVDILVSASVVDEPISSVPSMMQTDDVYTSISDIDTRNGKIIQPTKMRVKFLCANLSTVEDMMLAFQDVELTFTITSKAIIADEMVFTDLLITQTPNMLSAVELQAEFEQAGRKVYNPFDPANPTDEATYGVRIQSPTSALASALSDISGGLTSAAESLYNRVQSFV